ncbi:unnamed protein product [Phytophthora fragariaefolia]|uniref:Unnamed protein product n=1 Tax=Phytophthora fragariaefolia TaxID=1490495 RepID=A0A9W6TP80_9STRA|nr:unnamed protein product [Phytophthora fragariaefolia]
MNGHDPPDTGPPSDEEQTANTHEAQAGDGEAGERTIGHEVAETSGRRSETDGMECTKDAATSTEKAGEESPGSANLPTWGENPKHKHPRKRWSQRSTQNAHACAKYEGIHGRRSGATTSAQLSQGGDDQCTQDIDGRYARGVREFDVHGGATVRVRANAPHADLYKELFVANTDKSTGDSMMRALQRDVKRLSFDEGDTILFVFYPKRNAARWNQKALRYQKAVIVLQNTHRRPEDEDTGQSTAAKVDVQRVCHQAKKHSKKQDGKPQVPTTVEVNKTPKTNGLSDQLQEKSDATTATLPSKRKQKQKKQAALKENTPGDERKKRNPTLTKDGERTRPSTTTERFVKFQRAEAMGQFSVLADSDSEDDEMAFMGVDEGKPESDATEEEEDREEAPYAYDGFSAADESAAVQGRINDIEMIADQTDVNHQIVKAAINPDVDDEDMTAVQNQPGRPKPLKSGRKKKQHSQTRGFQDGALKCKQSTMTNYIQKGVRGPRQTASNVIETKVQEMIKALAADTYRDMVAASPNSQESEDTSQDQECIIGETKREQLTETRIYLSNLDSGCIVLMERRFLLERMVSVHY